MHGRLWTISNGLSMFRVVLAIPIVALILSGTPSDRIAAICLILLAVGTDFLDGLLARKLHQVSDMGKIIDPLADKLGIGAVAVALTVKGIFPLWLLLSVLARDILIFLGGVYVQRTKGVILQSTMVGKWAAASLAFLILSMVVDLPSLRVPTQALLVACVALLAVSFGAYTRRFLAITKNS
jgi:CDP-diacylglycerol--glycerol-3-phosphate 3-phosphatidyltransferase